LEALPNPDRLLQDGDVLETGDLKFSVLHTPGHSPGGVSLAGHGVIFTGDTLFRGNIGSTNNYGGNYEELIESVSSLLADFSDETVVLPGHGHRTTIGTERLRIGLSSSESPSAEAHLAAAESEG
jgi:glyoxylase-like metal-dependent hydrolase (beta-lactamase superfamily II)